MKYQIGDKIRISYDNGTVIEGFIDDVYRNILSISPVGWIREIDEEDVEVIEYTHPKTGETIYPKDLHRLKNGSIVVFQGQARTFFDNNLMAVTKDSTDKFPLTIYKGIDEQFEVIFVPGY